MEDRARTYQFRQDIYLRRGPSDGSFDCYPPGEVRAELEELAPPRFIRPAPPTYRSVTPSQPEVFLRPPPPVLPPPWVPVTPSAAKPAQSAPRRGTGPWWLLAALLGFPILVGLLDQAKSSLTKSLEQAARAPGNVSAAQPIVEVRRALPAVPRALAVTTHDSAVSNLTWQPVRMPDGSVVQACYQGELPSSAALPAQGRFIGEEWLTGDTSWIWTVPAGASFPSWVDP